VVEHDRLNQVPRGQGVASCVAQPLSLVPPEAPEYLPAGQVLHDIFAGTSLYLPAGQYAQWWSPTRLACCP